MSTKIDDSTSLASRLRSERARREWTLEALSQNAGVSRSMISKIERGEASPTAAILVRLGAAFGLTLAELLGGSAEPDSPLTREADQQRWTDPATGYVRRQIFARPDNDLELAEILLPAGARIALPAASYNHIQQLVWVLEGALVIEEGRVRHELGTGDCLAFGVPADTRFANETGFPCRYAVSIARRQRW